MEIGNEYRKTFLQLKKQIHSNISQLDTLLANISVHRQHLSSLGHQETFNISNDDKKIEFRYKSENDIVFALCSDQPLLMTELVDIEEKLRSEKFENLKNQKCGRLFPWAIGNLKRNSLENFLRKDGCIVFVGYSDFVGQIISMEKDELALNKWVNNNRIDESTNPSTQHIPLTIPISQLINHPILISFTLHKHLYLFSDKVLYFKPSSSTLLLLKLTASIQYTDSIRRVLIFKKYNQFYQIHKGFFEETDFIIDLELIENTQYIIMGSCDTKLQVYSHRQFEDGEIGTAQRTSIQLLNLMIEGFGDRIRRADCQFMRVSDLQMGIITQVYQNRLERPISFKNKVSRQQDISLMFPELYSPRMLSFHLQPKETLIFFYGINKKPATISNPFKQILLTPSSQT